MEALAQKRPAILIDLDGTVALFAGHRGPYDFDRVGEDLPNAPVVAVVRAMIAAGYAPVFMSGRPESCRRQSVWWLLSHVMDGIEVGIELHMRRIGDGRPDAVTKRELFERCVQPMYDVVAVFDDRNSVVEMWRNELGLTVFQVAEGDF